jgi:hypothetical protein
MGQRFVEASSAVDLFECVRVCIRDFNGRHNVALYCDVVLQVLERFDTSECLRFMDLLITEREQCNPAAADRIIEGYFLLMEQKSAIVNNAISNVTRHLLR